MREQIAAIFRDQFSKCNVCELNDVSPSSPNCKKCAYVIFKIFSVCENNLELAETEKWKSRAALEAKRHFDHFQAIEKIFMRYSKKERWEALNALYNLPPTQS